MSNRRSLVVKCFLIICVVYFAVYMFKSSTSSNVIQSLERSGRNLELLDFQRTSNYDVKKEHEAAAESNVRELQFPHLVPISLSLTTLKPPSVSEQVKEITQCLDKSVRSFIKQRGDYWVLYNYVRADRTLKCEDSITYTTHADYSFLDNLVPLIERWEGPVSVALHAPGADFQPTLDSIWYLRDCTSPLVKELATFHIYFSTKHVPKEVS